MMRRKGIFTLLTAVFMVMAFSAVTFAAQNVTMKTTTPNIPKSTCYQVGTDTMGMDASTTMREGDIIQFTVSNGTTICKPINMFLVISSAVAGVTQQLDDISDATAPVSSTNASDVITSSAALLATEQWGFLVQATAGSQLIRLTLRVRDSAANGGNGTVAFQLRPIAGAVTMTFNVTGSTSGDPTLDQLFVKLFDGKWVGAGVSGWYAQNAVPVSGVYDTALTSTTGPTTNVLCLDTLTQNFAFPDVENTYDSIINPATPGTKLSFSGDFRIAHLLSTQTFNLLTCKNAVCGNIALGVVGQSSSCVAFDYETNGTGTQTNPGNGYCTNHKADNIPKFILQSSLPFDFVPYTVTAEILVNGNPGDHGVYWSNDAPLYANSATTTCAATAGQKAFNAGAVTYFNGAGTTTGIVPIGAIGGNCAAVTDAAKAVKFTTTAQVLFANLTDFFFELNFPRFNYNLASVNVGDVVSVRVTLTKGTCGAVTQDICIGTIGCPAGSATAGRCILPFVPSLASGDTYWTGIAISNNSSVSGTVILTAYKKDGSAAATTSAITIPSKGMVSGFVYDTVSFPWTGTRPAGVPAYIQVDSTGFGTTDLNGFVFMADSIATADSDSMGYTCVK
jgi:hypothetical protein